LTYKSNTVYVYGTDYVKRNGDKILLLFALAQIATIDQFWSRCWLRWRIR